MAVQPLIAVMLSGGAGARLWPVSRESERRCPSFLSNFTASLLQRALGRVQGLPDVNRVLTVTKCR
jgi:mannose-1-phosphate guanylyltransferase